MEKMALQPLLRIRPAISGKPDSGQLIDANPVQFCGNFFGTRQ